MEITEHYPRMVPHIAEDFMRSQARGFRYVKTLCFFRALSLFDFESNGHYFPKGIAPNVIILI
jgi:hypothetical protein